MSMESLKKYAILAWLPALIVIWPGFTSAQVAVEGSGTAVETGAEEIPLLSTSDLEVLVGPIALYPDDLLAIVLPASTYPLQLVQAERFLQDLKNDPELEPNESWDDSIVALINYPEAVQLLTKDLDKTWRLGEAVVAQQADVIAAIESFRDRAYTAGNLQSDTHQTVSQNDGIIEIAPAEDDVIYVPYYEPERVVVYQPTPAYYYYPRAYPIYNYPYPYGHSFSHGFFWGVTTAFTIGWLSDSLHVYHHSYYGHPYYGYSYGHNYWYRQPSIYAHNNYYYNSHNNYHSGNRYGHGDYWRPHSGSTVSSHDQRVTRSRHYPGTRSGPGSDNDGPDEGSEGLHSYSSRQSGNASPDVKFRQRSSTISNQSSSIKPTQARTSQSRANQSRTSKSPSRDSVSRSAVAKQESPNIKFRKRSTSAPQQLAYNKPSQASRSSQPSRSSQATRSSQPSKSMQPSRSSQPSRSTQPSRSNQPSRSTQPSRSSQPSRSTQPSRSSQPQKSQSSKSGSSASHKVASTSAGKSGNRSSNRR